MSQFLRSAVRRVVLASLALASLAACGNAAAPTTARPVVASSTAAAGVADFLFPDPKRPYYELKASSETEAWFAKEMVPFMVRGCLMSGPDGCTVNTAVPLDYHVTADGGLVSTMLLDQGGTSLYRWTKPLPDHKLKGEVWISFGPTTLPHGTTHVTLIATITIPGLYARGIAFTRSFPIAVN